VEGAEAPNEVHGVDADNLAGGEAFGEDVEGVAVIEVVEGGDQDDAVSDVEVGVAGGEALALKEDGAGHGERDDFKLLALQVAGLVKALEVLSQREVVFVRGVGFYGGDDLVLGDEAGDVIDVAVGVVSGTATMEPDGLLDAEMLTEGSLQLLTGDTGVALLDLRQEALFCGDKGASAVDVYAAAFEDQAMTGNLWLALWHRVKAGYLLGDLVVATPVIVLGPGVEAPVGEGRFSSGGLSEDGAGVTEPDAVCGPGVEVEAGEVSSATFADGFCAALSGIIVDEDVDVFYAGEVADDFRVDPGDGLEFVGPILWVVGPGKPSGGVCIPLCGHEVLGRGG